MKTKKQNIYKTQAHEPVLELIEDFTTCCTDYPEFLTESHWYEMQARFEEALKDLRADALRHVAPFLTTVFTGLFREHAKDPLVWSKIENLDRAYLRATVQFTNLTQDHNLEVAEIRRKYRERISRWGGVKE